MTSGKWQQYLRYACAVTFAVPAGLIIAMKAITICQPYAHLIMTGEKRVENRTWVTRHRGPLLIHAGASKAWTSWREIEIYEEQGTPLVFGAILGAVDVEQVFSRSSIDAGDHDAFYPWLHDHIHAHGPQCWVLGRFIKLRQPIAWKGSQGLWNFPDELVPIDLKGA